MTLYRIGWENEEGRVRIKRMAAVVVGAKISHTSARLTGQVVGVDRQPHQVHSPVKLSVLTASHIRSTSASIASLREAACRISSLKGVGGWGGGGTQRREQEKADHMRGTTPAPTEWRKIMTPTPPPASPPQASPPPPHRLSLSGTPQYTSLSSRPGRSSAASTRSGREVAASTHTCAGGGGEVHVNHAQSTEPPRIIARKQTHPAEPLNTVQLRKQLIDHTICHP